MKKILALILIASSIGFCQFQIKGIISDSLTKEPLVGANINVNYGQLNAISDKNGIFNLKTSKSEIVIVVKYIGYKPFRDTYRLTDDIDLNIKLVAVSNDLAEVLVSSKGAESNIKRPLLGVSSLNIKTLNKIPSAMGELDIMRGLQMLPGVTSVGEAANGVNIRGGATDQNLILLDDAPIFNPTHMFGLFSAFPSEAISSFDLYKGNVPSRFGGRAAAVLDVSLANPSLDQFKMQGGVSMVSNRVKMDIPIIKEKLGVALSARGAFNDFLLPIISNKLDGIKSRFGDLSSKIFFRPNDKNTFSLSTYYTRDFFQTKALGSINEINSISTQYDYATFNNTLSWFKAISSTLNLQTKLISSNYAPITLLPELNSQNKVRIKSGIDFKQVKTNLNYFKGNQKIELGIDAIRYTINPGELDPGTNLTIKSIKNTNESANELGIYIEDELSIGKKLLISAGLRYSYFQNLGPSKYRTYVDGQPRSELFLIDTIAVPKGSIQASYGGFEPRIGIRYQLNKSQSLKFGYNLMRQYLQVVTNTTTPLPTSRWKTSDLYIKPQVSSLITGGFFHEIEGNIIEYSLEAYVRKTNNIVDYKPGADFLLQEFPESQILQGKNNSYGIEAMVSKKKGELTGWANYTYSRSLNKVDEGPSLAQQINNGNWYSANYDRPHSVNITAIINQGSHHDFSFNFTYSTGRPFTMPQGYISYQDRTYPFYALRNNARIPDYHRLDFSWNIYNPSMNEKRRFKGNWNFTVYNLYGRKNAYSVFLRSKGNNIEASRLTVFGVPIISLAYNFKFQ